MSLTVSQDQSAEARKLRKELKRAVRHGRMVRLKWDCVVWLKDALAKDDEWAFTEVWNALEWREQACLFISPSGGGIWETWERNKMREYWSRQAKRAA